MPLPEKQDNETEEDFISRCMSELKNEFPDSEQRTAVCYNQLKKKKENKSLDMFSVFSPVTKCWTETVEKSSGQQSQQRFFEVTVSGMKEDRDGEIMDSAAIEDMINQFKSGKIPLFPDHGRDPNTGERVYSWRQMMGVWVDAKLEGDKLKAIARLNNAHPDANLLWDFIQEGMPVGFSIGGKPVYFVDEEI